MFHRVALRGFAMALFMVALAGCGGGADDTSTGTVSTSSTSSASSSISASVPPAPTTLQATAGNAQASLTWSASAGATSYDVKRSTTNGGPYDELATATSPPFTDGSLINGTTYYYVVTAANADGQSADSPQAAVTPDPTITTPPVPMGLSATAGDGQVNLMWSASGSASAYRVKRATVGGGPYTQLDTSSTTTYSDTSVTNGTTYYYVVSAFDSAGESANSAQVSATPMAPTSTPIPLVPTSLTATAGNGQVTLNWSTSANATSYNVGRSEISGGSYMQIASPTSTSYIDSTASNGTTYYYVVSAVNSAGASANSAQVSALPVAPNPNPPSGELGTWVNVTPSNANPTATLDCGNYGTQTVQVDPNNPSNVYAEFNCQGIWKSTDYGQTWTGPINTGTNGSKAGDCAGGITLAPTVPATLFESCIRGNGLGFWISSDAGVDWTNINVVPPLPSGRPDVYQPQVDPYNPNHMLMAGHEQNYLLESKDGGHTWSAITMATGMMENGGTAFIFFINTGNAQTTASTWLWIAQDSGGSYGTWRTSNEGSTWTRVSTNEHPHGASQIYQPDTDGVIYMAGDYSSGGSGVLRSADYGQTWTNVGISGNQTIVFGTSKAVYAMYGWACTPCTIDPSFESVVQPGTSAWSAASTPSGMHGSGAGQAAVTNDGTHNVVIAAMWVGGLWRYVEP